MNEEFAKLISSRRKRKRIKKSELARYVGVSGQYIRTIEEGHIPSSEILERLADVLDIPEDIIFKIAGKLPPRIERIVLEKYLNDELDI